MFVERDKTDELKLANTGALQVGFLGVGSAFSQNLMQSNMLVIKGENHIAIDLGGKSSLALEAVGLNVGQIKNLLVTHAHADHIGGVEQWCLTSRYLPPKQPGPKPRLFTTMEGARVLWEASLRGGLEYASDRGPGEYLTLQDYVDIVYAKPLSGYGRPVCQARVGHGASAIDLKLMRTKHVFNEDMDWGNAFFSIGVLLDDRVLISGDTIFDSELLDEFGDGADLIFHDCQENKGGVHASYEELCGLSPQIKKKMILYHLSDEITQRFSPHRDGFYGWARSLAEGIYVFE